MKSAMEHAADALRHSQLAVKYARRALICAYIASGLAIVALLILIFLA